MALFGSDVAYNSIGDPAHWGDIYDMWWKVAQAVCPPMPNVSVKIMQEMRECYWVVHPEYSPPDQDVPLQTDMSHQAFNHHTPFTDIMEFYTSAVWTIACTWWLDAFADGRVPNSDLAADENGRYYHHFGIIDCRACENQGGRNADPTNAASAPLPGPYTRPNVEYLHFAADSASALGGDGKLHPDSIEQLRQLAQTVLLWTAAGRQVFFHCDEAGLDTLPVAVCLSLVMDEPYAHLHRLRPTIVPDLPFGHGYKRDGKKAPEDKALCVRVIEEFRGLHSDLPYAGSKYVQPLKKHSISFAYAKELLRGAVCHEAARPVALERIREQANALDMSMREAGSRADQVALLALSPFWPSRFGSDYEQTSWPHDLAGPATVDNAFPHADQAVCLAEDLAAPATEIGNWDWEAANPDWQVDDGVEQVTNAVAHLAFDDGTLPDPAATHDADVSGREPSSVVPKEESLSPPVLPKEESVSPVDPGCVPAQPIAARSAISPVLLPKARPITALGVGAWDDITKATKANDHKYADTTLKDVISSAERPSRVAMAPPSARDTVAVAARTAWDSRNNAGKRPNSNAPPGRESKLARDEDILPACMVAAASKLVPKTDKLARPLSALASTGSSPAPSEGSGQGQPLHPGKRHAPAGSSRASSKRSEKGCEPRGSIEAFQKKRRGDASATSSRKSSQGDGTGRAPKEHAQSRGSRRDANPSVPVGARSSSPPRFSSAPRRRDAKHSGWVRQVPLRDAVPAAKAAGPDVRSRAPSPSRRPRSARSSAYKDIRLRARSPSSRPVERPSRAEGEAVGPKPGRAIPKQGDLPLYTDLNEAGAQVVAEAWDNAKNASIEPDPNGDETALFRVFLTLKNITWGDLQCFDDAVRAVSNLDANDPQFRTLSIGAARTKGGPAGHPGGSLPLHLAAQTCLAGCVPEEDLAAFYDELCHKSKRVLDALNAKQKAPLHVAAAQCNVALADALLTHGAGFSVQH